MYTKIALAALIGTTSVQAAADSALPDTFSFTWSADKTTAELTLKVKLPNTSWMAFGFNSKGMGPGVDMVGIYSNVDGGVTVDDLWSTSKI